MCFTRKLWINNYAKRPRNISRPKLDYLRLFSKNRVPGMDAVRLSWQLFGSDLSEKRVLFNYERNTTIQSLSVNWSKKEKETDENSYYLGKPLLKNSLSEILALIYSFYKIQNNLRCHNDSLQDLVSKIKYFRNSDWNTEF